MSKNSSIEWTDHTWSPVWGCTQVSPACDHCYAKTLANRFGYGWNGEPMREFGEGHWLKPLEWNARARNAGRRERVFPSMCDPFDTGWPEGVRKMFWELIYDTPQLDWLLLTKRVGNVMRMLPNEWPDEGWPNVWLGATVINQVEADRDIPKLLEVPARVRFLSIEPMLGPIDLRNLKVARRYGTALLDCLTCDLKTHHQEVFAGPPSGTRPVDWVIAGGESGQHARPAHPDWFRSLRDQCAATAVPFLFKQWGEWLPVETDCGSDGDAYGTADDGSDRELSGRNVAIATLDDQQQMAKVGKKTAGRLIDGMQHDGVPA